MTRQRIAESVKRFTVCSAFFMVIFTSLRVYEFSLVYDRVEQASFYEWTGYLHDWTIACSLILAVFVLHFIISFIHLRAAIVITICLFAFFIAGSFALIQYFSMPLVPLSTDLFGYSWKDIAITVTSSGSVTPAAIFSFLLYLSCFIGGSVTISRLPVLRKLPVALALVFLMAATAVASLQKKPTPAQYRHETAYSLVVNKSSYFIDKTIDHLISTNAPKPSLASYPFLRDISYENVLSGYLGSDAQLPDIVFIIVEGLGSDFMSDGSNGGFTPFLDSLANESLYWKNALSNAGRTFGALPSLLGSLPYGKQGFMSYGAGMPDHQTLISLLSPLGYESSFFYGGISNFDNQDVFLEYQGIDYLLDETKFPASFRKMAANEEAFSWGYADRDVFDYSFERLKRKTASPQLNIYLTLSTHEPFHTPEPRYETVFEERLARTNWPVKTKKKYLDNKNIFSCLLYTDDVLRDFFRKYKKRPGFHNTIFVITGDHRLMPVPQETRLSRFRVPLMIYSPLQKSSQQFSSMAIHSDITPTLLGYLSAHHELEFPNQMPFISGPLSVQTKFSANLDLALIRNKNETIDYIEGEWFLSDNQLYKIQPDLNLEPHNDPVTQSRLQNKLVAFRAKSEFACTANQVDKTAHRHQNKFSLSHQEKGYLESLRVEQLSPAEIFEQAKSLAFQRELGNSRVLLKSLLNRSPNFHDARVLLARTYGWEGNYDSARWHLSQTLNRAPNYAEGYVALADVEYWANRNAEALKVVDSALAILPQNVDLQIRKARSLWLTGQPLPAKDELQKILQAYPEHVEAADLFQKITNENN